MEQKQEITKANKLKNALEVLYKLPRTEILEVVEALGEARLTPTAHLYKKYHPLKIKDASIEHIRDFDRQVEECPPLSIIDVVLAVNREYNVMVEPVIDELRKSMYSGNTDLIFLQQKTFASLLNYLKEHLPDFYDKYVVLEIKKGKAKDSLEVHRDFIKNILHFKELNFKKMKMIFEILMAIEKLKVKSTKPFVNDYEFLRDWATSGEQNYFKNDGTINKKKVEQALGDKIFNVGVATIQHLRMHFGANTFKPDQRVKEVLLFKFLRLSEEEFRAGDLSDKFAFQLMKRIVEYCTPKYDMRTLDAIFVNFGSGHYNKNTPSLQYTDTIVKDILRKLIGRGLDKTIISEVSGYTLTELNAN